MLHNATEETTNTLSFEINSRSARRHHLERVKQKRKGYQGHMSGTAPLDERQLGIVANTAKICSCGKCSKPRKHTLGLQELRQQQPKLHEPAESSTEVDFSVA